MMRTKPAVRTVSIEFAVNLSADADRSSNFRVSFFLYSLEGQEPPHIHVERADEIAKFWLSPVQLAESHGFKSHEITRLRSLVIEHRSAFTEAWHAHFGG